MSLDRRLERMEDVAVERQIVAARRIAEERVDRYWTIPAYRVITDALWDLVDECDEEPTSEWFNRATTKVVIATLPHEDGTIDVTPEKVEKWRAIMFRWMFVIWTPAGLELLRRRDELIEESAA